MPYGRAETNDQAAVFLPGAESILEEARCNKTTGVQDYMNQIFLLGFALTLNLSLTAGHGRFSNVCGSKGLHKKYAFQTCVNLRACTKNTREKANNELP